MKYFLFSFALLFLTIKGYTQQLGNDKIEPAYFQNLARFDTCDVVVLADDARLNFRYRSIYLGAVDECFRAEMSRQIRIKINRVNSLPHGHLTIAKIADSLSMDEISITDLTVYHYRDGKIQKDSRKANSSGVSLANGAIVLDLKNIVINDGAIVNFSYEITKVLKKAQRWNLEYPYYSASSSIEVSIPEIYTYHQETVNPNNFKIDYTSKKSQGILVGYYAPNVNLQHKLVSPAYYKLMKDKDPEVNKATKVYCGYTTHRFDAQDVFPIADVAEHTYIDFKLVAVNPILY